MDTSISLYIQGLRQDPAFEQLGNQYLNSA